MKSPQFSAPPLPILLLFLSLTGCGSTPATPPASPYLSLSGNWEILGLSTTGILTTPIASFTGSLQSSGATVTGTLRAYDYTNFPTPCVVLTQDLPATGTLDSAGNLTLTFPISGGAATIKAPLTSSFQTVSTGTFQIVGGPCAQASTTAGLLQYAPATGTYTGTVTSSSSSSTAAANVVLTQSTTPDVDGLYPLAGTITLAGPACNATFAFSGGTVTGNEVNLFHESTYQSPGGDFSAALLPDASGLQSASFTIYYPSTCGYLRAPLTRH